MATTGDRAEDHLIELFLTVYEDRSWAGTLSSKLPHDRIVDGGVEVIATRLSDGVTLAIEHTLIEPFVGEKTDFHVHFKKLSAQLRADETLKIPGHSLYIDAPVNVLPLRTNQQGIIDDVAGWLRAEARSFTTEKSPRDCPSQHHPDGTIAFQVALQPLGEPTSSFVIVQRYGEMKIDDAVRKALQRKLPKLAILNADRRLLILERDQGWLMPEVICAAIERLRPDFPEFQAVHEVWIADTATFEDKKEWVEFSIRTAGKRRESFAFYRNKLHSMSRNNIPVSVAPASMP